MMTYLVCMVLLLLSTLVVFSLTKLVVSKEHLHLFRSLDLFSYPTSQNTFSVKRKVSGPCKTLQQIHGTFCHLDIVVPDNIQNVTV